MPIRFARSNPHLFASFCHHSEPDRLEAALDRLNRASALGTIHAAERIADLDTTARLAEEARQDMETVAQAARASLQLQSDLEHRVSNLRQVAETCRLMAERAKEHPDQRPNASFRARSTYDHGADWMAHEKDDLSALFLAIAAAIEA